MNEQKDKPMPNIAYKVMTFGLALHHRFIDLRNQVEESGVREGQTVLDFGCGPGHYTIAAAKVAGEKGRVYALDIHPLAIRDVLKKARREGLNNITTILSGRDTGLPDESIDVVLLYDTIQLSKDKPAVLEELHRVMKPDGTLSLWPMKVEKGLKLVEGVGPFTLRNSHSKILNFERSPST